MTDTVVHDAARECLASLIASLADNKAALGHRYGEWAVSAPTLESAVAAAAMAQDELGHARSTYPLLKQLGAGHEDEEAGGDQRLELLDEELPDWPAFIAANLLVDGMLTTFVAACRDSEFEPLAQRARKILQEEGPHKVHAEAWARRLCRGPSRDVLLERLRDTWREAAAWPGPDDEPGFQAAVDAGLVAQTPAQLRERMRSWLVGVLAAERVEIELDEPREWSTWDPERRRQGR